MEQKKDRTRMKPLLKISIPVLFLLLIVPVVLPAQVDFASSLHISAENDFFVMKGDATDRYYTNGVRVDYYFKQKKRNFPSTLLLKIGEDRNIYSLGIAQYMFTPAEIGVSTIQYGDHPYAGALFGVYSLFSYDFSKRIRVNSEIYFETGVITESTSEVIFHNLPKGTYAV